jgi:hypothetical protein
MLRFEHGDRVRLVVASCLTLIALPVLLREGKDERAERPPTVAAVALRGEALASPLGDETSSTTAADDSAPSPPSSPPASTATTDSDPPAFLSSIPAETSNAIVVAVPTEAPATTQAGQATYRRWPPGAKAADPCAAWFLKVGTKVTVTNLDNGHTVVCTITDRTGVPTDATVVLDTPTFSRLADLIEAPIPVSISWS